MFQSFDHHQGAVCSLLEAVNVFNNVILSTNRQLPDDDRMNETCQSIFKSFNCKQFKRVHWLVCRSSDSNSGIMFTLSSDGSVLC